MSAALLKWAPTRNGAGSMLAFFSVELPSGLIVNDLKLMIGPNGARWVAMPSVKALDRDGKAIVNAKGKPVYTEFVSFRDGETKGKFVALCLDLIGREHPEAMGDDGALLAGDAP